MKDAETTPLPIDFPAWQTIPEISRKALIGFSSVVIHIAPVHNFETTPENMFYGVKDSPWFTEAVASEDIKWTAADLPPRNDGLYVGFKTEQKFQEFLAAMREGTLWGKNHPMPIPFELSQQAASLHQRMQLVIDAAQGQHVSRARRGTEAAASAVRQG